MSISRRHLLAGAGALFALAACGDDSSSGSSGSGSLGSASGDSEPDPGTAGFTIAQRYPANTFVPGTVRLPISLANKQNLLTTGPAVLEGRVLDSNDKQIATVTASIHSKDIVIPYWPVNVQMDAPGTYTLRINGDDGFGAAFQVTDPSQVTVPYIGSALPPFDTPTVDNHRGVEPYCTLTPAPCPLHDITLTQAMATGKPVAYMIGTPAHCQTGTCAPALEFLVKSHQRLGDAVAMVHADVYADDSATAVAPAVTALGLEYEPVLYLVKDGLVKDRIDVVWDQSELDERLDAFLE
ncbi:MAG TPA: hypothetical protein VFE86_16060 [Ilumatobacteraceae bacterium]|nr:hypothetical protein [Ilumatobacteraceae bacterium]